jgi:hypothetical protein
MFELNHAVLNLHLISEKSPSMLLDRIALIAFPHRYTALPTARHIRAPAIPARGLYRPAAPRPTPDIWGWGSATVTPGANVLTS